MGLWGRARITNVSCPSPLPCARPILAWDNAGHLHLGDTIQWYDDEMGGPRTGPVQFAHPHGFESGTVPSLRLSHRSTQANNQARDRARSGRASQRGRGQRRHGSPQPSCT